MAYRSVQESVGSTSGLKSPSPDIAPLPPSRTTRKPRGGSGSGSPKRKSSAMLWDSMEDPGMESWIASLRASRANRIVWPGSAKEPQTNDGSGLISPASSERLTPALLPSKTSLGCSATQQPAAMLQPSGWKTSQMSLLGEWEPFSGIWPQWGVSLAGECYELPKWAPATVGRGPSFSPSGQPCSWSTPRTVTGGAESAERKRECGRTESGGGDLQAQVLQWVWPSPAARDWRSPNAIPDIERRGTDKGQQLPNFVEAWHTPHGLANHAEGAVGEFAEQATKWECLLPVQQIQSGLTFWQRVRILRRLCLQLRSSLPTPYRKGRSMFRRKLNPDFTDLLMGWLVGWSSGSENVGPDFNAAVTEWFHSNRRLCSLYSREG